MKIAEKTNSIFLLRISYDGLDNVIWRDVTVDKDMPLNQLAYLILVAFDTMAEHMYMFRCAGEAYSEKILEDFEGHNARRTKLADLHLLSGDTLEMEYDMGVGHLFNIMVVDEKKCKADCHTPMVIDGSGCGIMEEENVMDLAHYIEQIDLLGKTTKPIYYKQRMEPWDYRNFDIDAINRMLKEEIAKLSKAYNVGA